MSDICLFALGATVALLSIHTATCLLVAVRIHRGRRSSGQREPVTLVVSIAGLDASEMDTAMSALALAGPDVEVLYCGFSEAEPAVRFLRHRLASSLIPNVRVLVGRHRHSRNPKVDNIEKAYSEVRTKLVAFVDGNLLMPHDFVSRLMAEWDEGVGAVSSPPLGVEPRGFWAEVECAMLNTQFLRYELAADSLGTGYVHGKVFMVRPSLLSSAEGGSGLDDVAAEDAAATRLVRAAGLKVRLTRRPFEQPIGRRRYADVWSRSLRWAQLRRHAYPIVFVLEPAMTSVPAAVLAFWAAPALGWPALPVAIGTVLAWYGVEAILALVVRWPLSHRFLVAAVIRDGIALAVWFLAWFRTRYVWRGQSIDLASHPLRKD